MMGILEFLKRFALLALPRNFPDEAAFRKMHRAAYNRPAAMGFGNHGKQTSLRAFLRFERFSAQNVGCRVWEYLKDGLD